MAQLQRNRGPAGGRVRSLGDDFVAAGVSFLAWCVEQLSPLDEGGSEGPFLGLALLSLALEIPSSNDGSIIGLCKWIDESVSLLLRKQQRSSATERPHWLIAINDHNLKKPRWIELGREFYHSAEAQPPSEKTTWVALIGRSLADD